MSDPIVEIQGKSLKLSNLQKVLYPAAGFTKKDVIDYYVRIAPAILPHLHQRCLTRKRYPDGVDAEPFFEKNAPQHKPAWVKTAGVWSEGGRRTVHYILADDLATLVWLANLAALIGIPYSYHAPASYAATNVIGTLNILEACRRAKVRRLVVIEAQPRGPWSERDPGFREPWFYGFHRIPGFAETIVAGHERQYLT